MAAKQATNVDQWQVNTGVHYNSWADLGKGDFVPVVSASTRLHRVSNILPTPRRGRILLSSHRCRR